MKMKKDETELSKQILDPSGVPPTEKSGKSYRVIVLKKRSEVSESAIRKSLQDSQRQLEQLIASLRPTFDPKLFVWPGQSLASELKKHLDELLKPQEQFRKAIESWVAEFGKWEEPFRRWQEEWKQFEESPPMLLYRAIFEKDEKALRALLDSPEIGNLIKKEVDRINRVFRLDKDGRISRDDGKSLACLVIKDAQLYYKNPQKAERYSVHLPVKTFAKRVRELFKRVFFYRLTEKIGEEIDKQIKERQHGDLSKSTYKHAVTGESYLYLKDAAPYLGLTVRQLRYRIDTGKIPDDCYCRFNDLEGRPYYHRLKRMRVSPIMIQYSKISKLRRFLEDSEKLEYCINGEIYVPIRVAAEFLARKRGIKASSARKDLKRNRRLYKGQFHAGTWCFPKKRFGKP